MGTMINLSQRLNYNIRYKPIKYFVRLILAIQPQNLASLAYLVLCYPFYRATGLKR